MYFFRFIVRLLHWVATYIGPKDETFLLYVLLAEAVVTCENPA